MLWLFLATAVICFALGQLTGQIAVPWWRRRAMQQHKKVWELHRTGLPEGYVRNGPYQCVSEGRVLYDGHSKEDAIALVEGARERGKEAHFVAHGKNRG